jgi:hypothetical protein
VKYQLQNNIAFVPKSLRDERNKQIPVQIDEGTGDLVHWSLNKHRAGDVM